MSEQHQVRTKPKRERVELGEKGSVVIERGSRDIDSVALLKAAIRKLYGEVSPLAERRGT